MRLPLTGLLGCGLLRVFRTACRLFPISCVCSFAVPLFFVSFSLPFFCLYFFSLYVSVLFSFCAVSPVSLFLVSDTRVSCIPTPGCRAYRDPGVRHAETQVSDVPRPGCQTCRDPGVRRAETRMSDMSRPGCHTMPFRISVFSFSLPLFLSARMRIYYNVSLLPDFPSSLKNMFFNTFVNQRFIKMFKRNSKKSPDIFGLYVIKSYFCTRFREREQRCIDILTGTA